MNRRKFIGSTIAVIGMMTVPLAVSTKKWHEMGYYGPLTAEQFMTKAWNDHVKGTGTKRWPLEMTASPALYDYFESNISCMQRFTSRDDHSSGVPSLAFKTARLHRWESKGGINEGDKHWCLIIKDPNTSIRGHYYDITHYGWAV